MQSLKLKTEKDLQIDLEEINYNPYDVIFANGIYNVQTGHMRDGCPTDCYIAANAAKIPSEKGKKRSSPMTQNVLWSMTSSSRLPAVIRKSSV